MQHDYGTLAPLVKTVGWLVSATVAISLTWRRRSHWEPSEEDIPKAPARVSGVLTAVGIALIWSQMSDHAHVSQLTALAIGFAIGCILSLLFYSFLVSTNTFTVRRFQMDSVTETRIIGGFSLTPMARNIKGKKHLTDQELLEGGAYDPDKVWTRPSRAWAKLLFVLGYIGLSICGSIALTCAAIMLMVR